MAVAQKRWITELGLGVDVHGSDYTKAAKRAISDALRHSSLNFFEITGKSPNDMNIEVVLGASPNGVIDSAEVAKEIPYGTVTVTVVPGGLDVPSPNGKDQLTMVNAAILVSFDD